MSQAQPSRSPSRPRRDRRQGRTSATVTDLETRRQRERAKPRKASQAKRPPRRGGLARLPLFLAGMGLGYGLSGPLPQLAQVALGALPHPSGVLTSLVTPAGMGNRRIVVMGTDNVSTNTDVMFTLQLKDGRTELTQIPRDTFIESDRYGVMKANALYSSGDVAMVKQELTKLIAAPVDRYLLVNLQAVQRLADALGGVEVDVPKRLYYVDNSQGLYIDLYPGRQLLKGEALEGFLRFRHDELGDLGRMERQKLVLREVFRKLAQPSTLAQLPALLKIAGDDVKTDLTPVEMGQLLTAMAGSKLSTSQLPGRVFWQNDLSYWMPSSNTHYSGVVSNDPAP
jgi:LCP family protein required for cell wall assembly